MAQAKKKWVAFRTNATVPAAVTGDTEDRKMQVGAPVQLPADYADHVVHDRFADFCDPPKKPASRKPAEQKAAAEAAAKLEMAEKRVDELNARRSEMSEGDDGWDDLTRALDEAVAALAALKPAA